MVPLPLLSPGLNTSGAGDSCCLKNVCGYSGPAGRSWHCRRELIDGKRTVRRIIEELAEHFNYEENYESRITAYITQLQKDGFVKLVIEN